jgi:hypothetical protein
MARQRIQLRRDTAAAWAAANPVLLSGEAGYETDTRQLKIGNGSSAWNSLDYVAGGGSGVDSLIELSDVDATDRVDGSVLFYDVASAKFVADDITTRLTLTDGGNF